MRPHPFCDLPFHRRHPCAGLDYARDTGRVRLAVDSRLVEVAANQDGFLDIRVLFAWVKVDGEETEGKLTVGDLLMGRRVRARTRSTDVGIIRT